MVEEEEGLDTLEKVGSLADEEAGGWGTYFVVGNVVVAVVGGSRNVVVAVGENHKVAVAVVHSVENIVNRDLRHHLFLHSMNLLFVFWLDFRTLFFSYYTLL